MAKSGKSKDGSSGPVKEDPTSLNSQAISSLLHLIKSKLESLPTHQGLSFDKVLQWSATSGIAIPWVGVPKPDAEERGLVEFGVAPPSAVSLVGSFLLGTMVTPANVDLAVEFPKVLY